VETAGPPAIREKKFGMAATSWRELASNSRDIAFGLDASASGPATSPRSSKQWEWVMPTWASCAPALSSGIYPTDSSSQVEYLINDPRQGDLRGG